MIRSNLASLKIERRRISVAVFVDERLDYTATRHLPSVYAKALDSATRYVDWITRTFTIEGAALEKNHTDPNTWKSKFTKEIIGQLRDAGVPIFEVSKDALLGSFAHPPLRYKTELREVVSSMWPILATKDNNASLLDAAALGLYVQVEKIFRA